MNKRQLAVMEKKFGVKLPAAYRGLLLSPPRLLLMLLKWEDADNDESQTPLFRSPKLISGMNEWVRDPDDEDFVFDANNPRRRWPDKYFIIGGTCGGDYYCIKPSAKKKTEVFLWNHDGADFEKCADSFRDYVKHMFQFYAEVATWDLQDA